MEKKKKRKGGRPKMYEQHEGYSYVNKKGTTVRVKAHREKYTK